MSNIAVIGSPCHAESCFRAFIVFNNSLYGSEISKEVSLRLSSHYINARVHEDIIGAEHAAMLKNIYAIAAGISHGLGYGDNFQSVLMSSAIREMKRFKKYTK